MTDTKADVPTCGSCGKQRQPGTPDYNAIILVTQQADPGWYHGDDGDVCGPCMLALFKRSNRL